jgi:MoaE-MoaD fusion protein
VEVTVRLFAMLRERAGAPELVLELPEGARVRDALVELSELAAGLPLVMAVNREYAGEDDPLSAGDELALIPPVSGGADVAARAPWTRVTADPLSLESLTERVRDPRAGAVVTFQGVTRVVELLEYEAYEQMAAERLAEIAADAVERHGLCAAAVEHRVGRVPLSEPSVAVAVSAPHRPEAFTAAREIIDRVKAEAPIWKKELDGGEGRWVEGRVPEDTSPEGHAPEGRSPNASAPERAP